MYCCKSKDDIGSDFIKMVVVPPIASHNCLLTADMVAQRPRRAERPGRRPRTIGVTFVRDYALLFESYSKVAG